MPYAIKSIFLQDLLRREHVRHRDLLQHRFIDTAFNLTFKTMFGLKYTLNQMRHAKGCLAQLKWLMKVDQNVFLNPEPLWKDLKLMEESRSNYVNEAYELV